MNVYPATWGRCEARLAAAIAGLASLLVWATVFDGARRVGPLREVLSSVPMSDKIGHFVIYGLIAFFVALLAKRPSRIWASAGVVMFIGIADEIRQIGEFGRTFSLADLGANALGILVGVTVAKAVIVQRTQRNSTDSNEHSAFVQV